MSRSRTRARPASSRLVRLLLAAAVLMPLFGCASGSASPFLEEGQALRRLEIHVDNLAYNDATIFAVTQSRRLRLGIVQSKSNRRFTIEWAALQDLQIEIDLLASQRFVSDLFSLAPGEFLDVQVQEPVTNTVISRRNRR